MVSDSTCASLLIICMKILVQEKVLFYQEYICPTHEDPRKKPFVVIIQNGFMMDIAKRFSSRNSWAFDSTFKTNKGESIIGW